MIQSELKSIFWKWTIGGGWVKAEKYVYIITLLLAAQPEHETTHITLLSKRLLRNCRLDIHWTSGNNRGMITFSRVSPRGMAFCSWKRSAFFVRRRHDTLKSNRHQQKNKAKSDFHNTLLKRCCKYVIRIRSSWYTIKWSPIISQNLGLLMKDLWVPLRLLKLRSKAVFLLSQIYINVFATPQNFQLIRKCLLLSGLSIPTSSPFKPWHNHAYWTMPKLAASWALNKCCILRPFSCNNHLGAS